MRAAMVNRSGLIDLWTQFRSSLRSIQELEKGIKENLQLGTRAPTVRSKQLAWDLGGISGDDEQIWER